MKLLIGSNNKHKAEEFQQIFSQKLPGKIELVMPRDVFNQNLVIVESGSTFRENALLKAKGFFEKSGLPCFSDDSGLEVRCLYGAPGINSARYAGENATDEENRKKIISKIINYPIHDRLAQFRAVICYYDGKEEFFAEGICKGILIANERGKNGFGYDPIFIPEGYDITFAEMDPIQKNMLSHRRKAINQLIEHFEKIL